MTGTNITKLEAAQRQLETAIRLMFSGGDTVSIYTLVGASFRILRDIADASTDSYWKRFKAYVLAPGEERLLHYELNKAGNFFKHADRDRDLSFQEEDHRFLDIMIMLACITYGDLSKMPTRVMDSFAIWHTLLYPELFAQTLSGKSRWKFDALVEFREGLVKTIDLTLRENQIELGAFILAQVVEIDKAAQ